MRNRPGNISAYAVGGLAQYAKPCFNDLREMLCQCMNIRVLRMMLRQVAEKDRGRLTIDEAGCHCARTVIASPRRPLNALFSFAGNFHPLRFGSRFQNLRQHRRHCHGSDNGAVRHLGKQIIIDRIDQIQLRTLLHCLAQTLRDKRVILAQRAADHQRGLQPGKIRDAHPQPRRALQMCYPRENRIGSGDGRYSHCPIPASVFAADIVLPGCYAEKPARRYVVRHIFLLPPSIHWQRIPARFASRIPAIPHHALSLACSSAPRSSIPRRKNGPYPITSIR